LRGKFIIDYRELKCATTEWLQ